jgi:prepilin peptidase CpaA
MALRLELLPLVGFAALMIAVVVIDFRRLIIPNPIVVALCALWPLQFGTTPEATLAAAVESVACAAIMLAGGAILFARGVVGGGDVKLLAAVSLWVGPTAVPKLLLLTALLGGVLAVAFLTPLGTLLSRRGGQSGSAIGAPAMGVGQVPLPYGAAIAGAALVVAIPANLA